MNKRSRNVFPAQLSSRCRSIGQFVFAINPLPCQQDTVLNVAVIRRFCSSGLDGDACLFSLMDDVVLPPFGGAVEKFVKANVSFFGGFI